MAKRTMAVCALLATLALASSPVEAAKPRRARGNYVFSPADNFAVGGPGPVPTAFTSDSSKTYTFDLRKGERYVSVSLVDEGEGDVAGSVSQWVMDKWYGDEGGTGAGTGHAVTYVSFCNRTESPVKLKKKIEVEIMVVTGTCEDGTPSTPTNGSITLDFFKP
jgi:hypothetical protein